MARFFALYDRLLDWSGHVPGLIVAAMALGISIDVTMRNLSLGSVPWALEMVEYAMFGLTFAGAAYVLRAGRHVRIDLVASFLGPRGNVVSELVAALVMLVITSILLWYGLQATLLAAERGAMLRQHFDVPEWVPLTMLPAAWLLVLIECARRVWVCVGELSGRPARGTAR